jgi:hypothetical protein
MYYCNNVRSLYSKEQAGKALQMIGVHQYDVDKCSHDLGYLPCEAMCKGAPCCALVRKFAIYTCEVSITRTQAI